MNILSPGDTFAGCRILTLCGHGGMGVVYLASDAMERKVALKIMALSSSERELRGIRRYGSIAETQKNLIKIYHAGIEDGRLFYIMEAADPLEKTGENYVPKTLSSILDRQGKLDPDQALSLVHSLADGLSALHREGLIHCDVKPENIVFVNNVPKLCDPGLVAQSGANISFVGTLGYLPKECFDGTNLNTPGRDVYALGKLFYVAVTGELPANFPRIPADISPTLRRRLWPVLIRVCSENPKHRFQTAEAFVRVLPAELPKPTYLEKKIESFRMWRISHPRFMPLFCCCLVLLFAGGAFASWRILQEQRMREACLLDCEKKSSEILRKISSLNEDDLFLQTELHAGRKAAEDLRRRLKTLPEEKKKRLDACVRILSELEKYASEMLPRIPEKASFSELWAISEKVRSLAASPLGKFLPEEKLKKALAAVTELEKNSPFGKSFLFPGKPFVPDTSFRSRFIYVPAGCFRASSGRITKTGAFWCCDVELRSDSFYPAMNRDVQSQDASLPACRFLWNDLLDYCSGLTKQKIASEQIPSGFIVRPLTTREWQWAARGAWKGAGKASVFQRNNSFGRAHPVSSGTPNALGLYNMVGNVEEITLPDAVSRIPNNVEICGGYYNTASPHYETCMPYPCFQFIPPYVGTRLAIAPGPPDFFEKNFWHPEARELVYGGKHYELFSTIAATFSRKSARELCSLLGGRLPVIDQREQWKIFDRNFSETRSFPAVISEKGENPVRGAASLAGHPSWSLTFHAGKQYILRAGPAPACFCEWNEEEYRRRTELKRILSSPAAAKKFELDGRIYCFIRIPVTPYTGRRIAAILGGKLAEMRSDRIRRKVKEFLASEKKESVLLGGYWHFREWIYPDGTKMNMDLPVRGPVWINSEYLAGPGLRNGEFCSIQICSAFLLEFPAP